jgi:hypothetical protein
MQSNTENHAVRFLVSHPHRQSDAVTGNSDVLRTPVLHWGGGIWRQRHDRRSTIEVSQFPWTSPPVSVRGVPFRQCVQGELIASSVEHKSSFTQAATVRDQRKARRTQCAWTRWIGITGRSKQVDQFALHHDIKSGQTATASRCDTDGYCAISQKNGTAREGGTFRRIFRSQTINFAERARSKRRPDLLFRA